MSRPLVLHPDFTCPAVTGIEADARRTGDMLDIVYRLAGDTSALAIAAPMAVSRMDDLWKTTCFEAFVRGPTGEIYYEYNFSPSMRWAGYRFDSFRAGMANSAVGVPEMTGQRAPDSYVMTARVDLGGLPELAGKPWRVALTTVVEAGDGTLSYWSLKHAPVKADFHHADGFVWELAAT